MAGLMAAVDMPPGAVAVTADELAAILARGGHPDDGAGTADLGAALVDLVRTGRLLAVRLPDSRLAFSPNPTADPAEETR
ncbi:hypothetical protein [Parafrankia sp. EUN1f]|uniref:hypothetical protein n=1 Tax=Parafrankia sp. EUN1f TaxID=102897 RepID=UPI0001C44A7E|nr:hypothetical protein [Parafrankia sp. EUN1f]EFC84501.1 hypothetical protein FrEUN1fDRAFT_2431 [Parafrankia sp. EUN1f]